MKIELQKVKLTYSTYCVLADRFILVPVVDGELKKLKKSRNVAQFLSEKETRRYSSLKYFHGLIRFCIENGIYAKEWEYKGYTFNKIRDNLCVASNEFKGLRAFLIEALVKKKEHINVNGRIVAIKKGISYHEMPDEEEFIQFTEECIEFLSTILEYDVKDAYEKYREHNRIN